MSVGPLALAHGLQNTEEIVSKNRADTMSSYAIIRIQKLKSDIALQRSLKHSFREQTTPNADPERFRSNVYFNAYDSEGALRSYTSILNTLTKKIRSNAVRVVEFLITASPEAMNKKTKHEQMEYFRDALAFLQDKHGAQNVICGGVHFDETTPHMYAYVVPIDEKKHLNCRHFYGAKDALSQLQTDFAAKVGARNGFERGIEGSKAEHQTLKTYYTKIKQELAAKPSLDPNTANVLHIKYRQLTSKHKQVIKQYAAAAKLHRKYATLLKTLEGSQKSAEITNEFTKAAITSVWDEALKMNLRFTQAAAAKAKAKSDKEAKEAKAEAAKAKAQEAEASFFRQLAKLDYMEKALKRAQELAAQETKTEPTELQDKPGLSEVSLLSEIGCYTQEEYEQNLRVEIQKEQDEIEQQRQQQVKEELNNDRYSSPSP